MNERIKLLALRAGATDQDGGRAENIFCFTKNELDGFAELIVKECASICELNGQSYKHSFTPAKARLAKSTSVFCGTLIKKHFGVEGEI